MERATDRGNAKSRPETEGGEMVTFPRSQLLTNRRQRGGFDARIREDEKICDEWDELRGGEENRLFWIFFGSPRLSKERRIYKVAARHSVSGDVRPIKDAERKSPRFDESEEPFNACFCV